MRYTLLCTLASALVVLFGRLPYLLVSGPLGQLVVVDVGSHPGLCGRRPSDRNRVPGESLDPGLRDEDGVKVEGADSGVELVELAATKLVLGCQLHVILRVRLQAADDEAVRGGVDLLGDEVDPGTLATLTVLEIKINMMVYYEKTRFRN